MAAAGQVPTTLTLNGFGAIKIGMNVRQVADLTSEPIIVAAPGTSAWSYVPICEGDVTALADFFGPDQA